MSIKEQIRAEIERRIKELDEQIVDIYDSKAVLRKDELQRLLSFLNTLPEQPVTDCHELKKHILEWTELMVGASFPEQDGDYISEQDYRNVIKQTARHFAEWGKNNLK